MLRTHILFDRIEARRYLDSMEQSTNKTVLAIDYGTRRIGLAKSDPTGLIASALETLEVKSQAQALRGIGRFLEEYHPATLVVGYPLLASGDRSSKCDEIDRFIEKLRGQYGGPIHRVDEHSSTVEAAAIIHAHGKRVGQDKRRLDRLAAVLILQRYLDGQREE